MKIKQGSMTERLAQESATSCLILGKLPMTAKGMFEAICAVADMSEEERSAMSKKNIKDFRKEYNDWRNS